MKGICITQRRGLMIGQDDWLQPEKQFLRHAIEAGKRVPGICLGAQQIASAMGAKGFRTGNARSVGSPSGEHRRPNAGLGIDIEVIAEP